MRWDVTPLWGIYLQSVQIPEEEPYRPPFLDIRQLRIPFSSAGPEPHIPEIFKAALNGVAAEEQLLEGQRLPVWGEPLQRPCVRTSSSGEPDPC
jgi:hypothetical protein